MTKIWENRNGKCYCYGRLMSNPGCHGSPYSNCRTCCYNLGLVSNGINPAPIIDGVPMKIIQKFNLNVNNISSNGERRSFSITGDKGAVFTLIVQNSAAEYYNFSTNSFQAAKTTLKRSILNNEYKDSISFPAISSDDQYNINLFAANEKNTVHTRYQEVRFKDGSLDINSSIGSNSSLLQKIIYQYDSPTITLTAAARTIGDAGVWSSLTVTPDTLIVERTDNRFKKDFTITVTADNSHSMMILNTPKEDDIYVSETRVLGSNESLPISGSDYYRWNIASSSSIHGLIDGMEVTGTNVTAGTIISTFEETLTITTEGSDSDSDCADCGGGGSDSDSDGSDFTVPIDTKVRTSYYKGVDPLSYKPTVTDGIISKQLGNLTFNLAQATALADDTVTIYATGPRQIESLTGSIFKVSNLKIALTDVETTVDDASATGSASLSDFDVDSVVGIMDDVSVVSGVNITASTVNPTVTTISSSNLTVSPGGHYLQDGQDLTFTGASTIATITGTIETIKQVGGNLSLTFNVENFLKAV